MNETTKKLLNEVIEDRLEQALDHDPETEEAMTAHKQAMEAIDRQIELSKIEASLAEQKEKKEMCKKERWIRCGEIAATVIAAPLIGYCCNKSLMKITCLFEKDYTFTTAAGKSLSKMFRFGK